MGNKVSDEILKMISDKVDKLDSKIDTIISDITEIKVTSARHEVNLQMHMKRSDAAETGINMLKDELVPIKKHVNAVDVVVKLIAFASTVIGTILGFLKLIKKI